MIINDIKKVPKKSYYLVTIDYKDYQIEELVLTKYDLYEGMEIDSKKFFQILDESEISSGYNMAVKYLVKYVKSETEIRRYLLGKKIKSRNINIIIDKLKQNRLINDGKMIDAILTSLILSGNGINLIRHKLYQKGFDKELIDSKLEDLDEELYVETINKMYEKALKRYKKYDEYVRINKVKSYLVSRGYTLSDIEKLNI